LNAKGAYLYFLDDDVTVPEDFFNRWNGKVVQYPSLMVVGGPNLDPEENTPFQRSVGYILGSWWGAGRMSERYRGLPDDRWVDDRSLILCNLCFHRDVFHRMGLRFHDQLFYNEENLLLQELIARGVPLLHSPTLVVRHTRRGTWSGYGRQIWHSGKGRGQMTRYRPSTVRAVHLFPALFLLSLPLSFFMPAALKGPLALYAFLTAAHALVYGGRTGDWLGVLRVGVLTVGGHVVYGMGFLRGFIMGITDEGQP